MLVETNSLKINPTGEMFKDKFSGVRNCRIIPPEDCFFKDVPIYYVVMRDNMTVVRWKVLLFLWDDTKVLCSVIMVRCINLQGY